MYEYVTEVLTIIYNCTNKTKTNRSKKCLVCIFTILKFVKLKSKSYYLLPLNSTSISSSIIIGLCYISYIPIHMYIHIYTFYSICLKSILFFHRGKSSYV